MRLLRSRRDFSKASLSTRPVSEEQSHTEIVSGMLKNILLPCHGIRTVSKQSTSQVCSGSKQVHVWMTKYLAEGIENLGKKGQIGEKTFFGQLNRSAKMLFFPMMCLVDKVIDCNSVQVMVLCQIAHHPGNSAPLFL